ncbi:MAG: S9 family peptidase, partial [Acidobacteria bacterium]|nr:S9 family peptidase [Acidobacteriota bacterium]
MKRTLQSLLCMALVLGLGLASAGQEKSRKLTMDTYMEMESVGAPQISPEGKQIIFSRGFVDKVNDQSRSNLWIVDVQGQRIRELTHGNWSDSSPAWSPDGQKIAFISDRDGTRQIHVMWLDTREVAQLTHSTEGISGLTWSPDGKQIAFTSSLEDKGPILSVKLPARPENAKWAKPAVIIDRLSWRRDGVGPIPKGYTHVFVVDAILGGTPRQITSGDYNHGDPEWSRDGKKIYVSAIRKPDAEYLRGDSEIYEVDLATLAIREL